MSTESNMMAVPTPGGGYMLLPAIDRKVPKSFMGCKCPETLDLLSSRKRDVAQCDNLNCPCWMKLYHCTSKCKCRNCANRRRVVRGSGSSTEPGQGGTGCSGTSNVLDEGTSGMAREWPQVEEQLRGNKSIDLNELPSSDTEPGQADGDTSTGPGQGGTAGASNVPDETTSAPSIETQQADDTSGMAREPPQVEEQSRGNRGFDLNEVPSSNIEQGQANGTSSMAEGPAQITTSGDNRGFEPSKRP